MFMKTAWAKKVYRGLVLVGLMGAGVGFVGCADEYAAYPGYRGGYYASYSAGYPYYGGYGYPYRAYGPYYGGPSYGYGSPYYGGGGATVVYSGSRSYTYRDRYGRLHTTRRHANANRVRNTSSTTTRSPRTRTTRVPGYQSDDESRYYNNRPQ
jgi:hypothetical protein